jgi:hypothetical protein
MLANTPENNAKVKSLKKIAETKWVGNIIHDTMDKCLTGINLLSSNSGLYVPKAVHVNGLVGFYLVNQDGSLFCENRIIKEEDKKFRIEYMTTEGWNEFEQYFESFLD